MKISHEIIFECNTWGCEFDLNAPHYTYAGSNPLRGLFLKRKAKKLIKAHKKAFPTHEPRFTIKKKYK